MRRLALVVWLAGCRAAAVSVPAAPNSALAVRTAPLPRTFDVGARGALTLGQPRALADGRVTHPDGGVIMDCDGRCPDTIVAFAPPLPDSLAAVNATLDASGRVTTILGVYDPAQPLARVRAQWTRRMGTSPCFVSRAQVFWRDAATLLVIVADSAANAHLWSLSDMTRADLGDTSRYQCP